MFGFSCFELCVLMVIVAIGMSAATAGTGGVLAAALKK
jgi:hypothetical protein